MIKKEDIKELSSKVRKCLVYLGFNFANIGTIYLHELMMILLDDPNLIHSLTDGLLLKISQNHDLANIKNIERDIRSAIARAYSKGILKELKCFSYGRPPKIKELACFLFDYFTSFDYSY